MDPRSACGDRNRIDATSLGSPVETLDRSNDDAPPAAARDLPIPTVRASAPAEAGVEFLAARQATAVLAGAVQFGEDRLTFDLLLGVPPHRPPAVVAEAGLTRGGPWIPVDRLTLETDFPGVYAIGDVTAIPLANGQMLPKAGVFAEAQGTVVAERVAAGFAGRTAVATFTGEGACFFELGSGTAAMVAGHFLADPPDVRLSEPSREHLEAKRTFEADRLRSWFGR